MPVPLLRPGRPAAQAGDTLSPLRSYSPLRLPLHGSHRGLPSCVPPWLRLRLAVISQLIQRGTRFEILVPFGVDPSCVLGFLIQLSVPDSGATFRARDVWGPVTQGGTHWCSFALGYFLPRLQRGRERRRVVGNVAQPSRLTRSAERKIQKAERPTDGAPFRGGIPAQASLRDALLLCRLPPWIQIHG